MPDKQLPMITEGGMGVAVSDWRLANAVARTGQLALDTVLARRLQLGDPVGNCRALSQLPIPGMADRVLRRYFVEGGIGPSQPFRPVPRLGVRPNPGRTELTVVGNFVEVPAKEGHDGPVGINYLEKIQLATPAAVYGAMLAGVGYVLVGAGIPAEWSRLNDRLVVHAHAELSLTVADAAAGDRHVVGLDPATLLDASMPPPLTRPRLLAIVSSSVLAAFLHRNPETRPDGFVVETPAASRALSGLAHDLFEAAVAEVEENVRRPVRLQP